MKKLFLLLSTLLLGTSLSFAQSSRTFTASLSAACTNATTACDSTAGSQLKFSIGEYTIASVTVHGTFTGATLNFEFSDDGGTNWYPTTCTRNDAAVQEGSEPIADSTNRSWDCGTAAAGIFRIRLGAVSSGTVLTAATLSTDQVEPGQTVAISGATNSGTVGSACTVSGNFASCSPTQLGMNALAYGSNAATANTNIIDTRGVKAWTLLFNCTSLGTLQLNNYQEDGVTSWLNSSVVTTTVAAATSVTISAGGTTYASQGTAAATVQNLPQRAISFAFMNTNATAGTCTGRLFLSY